MLRIEREKQSLSLLETPTLADVSITERYDLVTAKLQSVEWLEGAPEELEEAEMDA